jgi:class 3 adenylate cyclase
MHPGRSRSLSAQRFGLRFEDRDTERRYQSWRRAAAAPFARIGYIGSIPSWVLVLVLGVVLDHRASGTIAAAVGGWIAFLVVLTALSVPASLQRYVAPLAALANCLAGFLVVWLLSDVALSGVAPQTRAGVMTAALIVVMYFGFAVFRIPPGLAIAAVTPYVAFGSLQLAQEYERGDLSSVEAGSLVGGQWIAYLGGLLVCLVVEVVDRRTFLKDQLIEAQQEELRASREAIRRYAPRAVSERIVRGDTVSIDRPTRRQVTVLMADLVAFTPLAERLEAELLTQGTNQYMTAMTEVVERNGGIVSEIAGDGLMAIFGAPDDMTAETQVLSAVAAAQAMHSRLPELDLLQGPGEPMRMRIGINTGVLSVGSFGSEGRMTYTAIGLHTNVAARLEEHCPPGRILMSESSWEHVRELVLCESLGAVVCKGVKDPVRVYSPCAPTAVGPAGRTSP